jgi:hypothetical protein
MKIHVTDAPTMLKHGKNFKTGHYLHLPNGKVISIGEIADVHEAGLIADGAIALPHMMDSSAIGPEVAAALAHLGIKPEHRTFDILLVVGKIHPAFKPSALG